MPDKKKQISESELDKVVGGLAMDESATAEATTVDKKNRKAFPGDSSEVLKPAEAPVARPAVVERDHADLDVIKFVK